MRVEQRVDSLSTFIVIDATDLVIDHQKRYYAVPRDYRPQHPNNPYDSEPEGVFIDEEHPDKRAFDEAMNLMNTMYWKILADVAEATYKAENNE